MRSHSEHTGQQRQKENKMKPKAEEKKKRKQIGGSETRYLAGVARASASGAKKNN